MRAHRTTPLRRRMALLALVPAVIVLAASSTSSTSSASAASAASWHGSCSGDADPGYNWIQGSCLGYDARLHRLAGRVRVQVKPAFNWSHVHGCVIHSQVQEFDTPGVFLLDDARTCPSELHRKGYTDFKVYASPPTGPLIGNDYQLIAWMDVMTGRQYPGQTHVAVSAAAYF